MLESHRSHLDERAAMGTTPLPLGSEQTTALVELLKTPAAEVEIS